MYTLIHIHRDIYIYMRVYKYMHINIKTHTHTLARHELMQRTTDRTRHDKDGL